jgi:DNA-binding transcriptional LysR family regulator
MVYRSNTPSTFTVQQVQAFVAVADLCSFTDAAKHLQVTQGTLSKLIRQLEVRVGLQLLDRSTTKVRVSAAGKDFYPFAGRMLDALSTAAAAATSLRERKRGCVRIAAPQMMSCSLIPSVIAAYCKEYPEVHVKLSETAPEQLASKIVNGDVELAVGPDDLEAVGVVKTTLMKDRYFLVCTKDHALASRNTVLWADLAAQRFVSPTRDFMTLLNKELRRSEVHIELEPIAEVSYMTTALAMAAAGLGATVCPQSSHAIVQAFGLVTRPLGNPEFFRTMSTFALRGASLSPAARGFLKFLQKSCSNSTRVQVAFAGTPAA